MIASLLAPSSVRAERIELRGGGTMYYETWGKGEPVVLLHGHTLDRRMWNEQVALLRDSFRVIVPDLRGYGLSSDPTEGFQFTHLDDVLALMDSLHITQAHVVGLSMGAFVAGDMVAMHPERLLSCVMVSGETCTYTGPSRPRSAQEKAKMRATARNNAQDIVAYKQRRIKALLNACHVRDQHVEHIITEEIMDWRAWQGLHVTGRIYYGSDAWPHLKRNRPQVPCLLIFGAKERTSQSAMLPYLKNGRQIIFQDCGHMVNIEQPELFNTTLTQWLNEWGNPQKQ